MSHPVSTTVPCSRKGRRLLRADAIAVLPSPASLYIVGETTVCARQVAREEFMQVAAVTGAWSYLGRHVAQVLLAQGQTVRSLTARPIPAADPFQGAVAAYPLTWTLPALTRALQGVETLYNTFWVRHTRPPIGRRGPWTLTQGGCSQVSHSDRCGPRGQCATGGSRQHHQSSGRQSVIVLFSGQGRGGNLHQAQWPVLRPSCLFSEPVAF